MHKSDQLPEGLLGDGLRTIEEAKNFTRLSRATLYLLMERGELAYTTIGRRRLIPHRALIELARRKLVGGGRSDQGQS
ncbi:MAG: helix-turn-helix domain-containing protein [Gemmataceae bacterium]